jgi:hypothetical protein
MNLITGTGLEQRTRFRILLPFPPKAERSIIRGELIFCSYGTENKRLSL